MESRTDIEDREAEATDDETLDDLEESFGSSDVPDSDDESVLSPDGSFDEDDELDQSDSI